MPVAAEVVEALGRVVGRAAEVAPERVGAAERAAAGVCGKRANRPAAGVAALVEVVEVSAAALAEVRAAVGRDPDGALGAAVAPVAVAQVREDLEETAVQAVAASGVEAPGELADREAALEVAKAKEQALAGREVPVAVVPVVVARVGAVPEAEVRALVEVVVAALVEGPADREQEPGADQDLVVREAVEEGDSEMLAAVLRVERHNPGNG